MLLQNGWIYSPSGKFEKASLVIKGSRIDEVIEADEPLPDHIAVGVEPTDIQGGYVLPGFVDSHIHLSSLALKTLRCDLSTATSARVVCDKLASWAEENDAPFVIGVDYDESRWDYRKPPTRAMLDGVDDKRPVFARRICGHVGVVNTPLLNLLKKRPGMVDEDTGIIREHAVWDAGSYCQPDTESVIAGMASAIDGLYRLGITTIHDIVEEKKFDTYLEGIRRADSPLRIDALVNTNPRHIGRYRHVCEQSKAGNVRVVGVKCFLDGSLGGWTAALNTDYADQPGWGTLLIRQEVLRAVAEECYDNGYACAVHAIGDRAVDLATGVFRSFPVDAEAFRIEHCEVAASAQIDGVAKAPVFLSLQPNFVRNWGGSGGLNETRLGKKRNRWCNAYRTLFETGKTCIFGSDGMPPGPLFGLKGAINHPVPEERLTPREAIACYTANSHTTAPHKREAGRLEPGHLADMVVLNKNPLANDPDTIEVLMTIVDGEVVFDAATVEQETADAGASDPT